RPGQPSHSRHPCRGGTYWLQVAPVDAVQEPLAADEVEARVHQSFPVAALRRGQRLEIVVDVLDALRRAHARTQRVALVETLARGDDSIGLVGATGAAKRDCECSEAR